ncbi:DUF4352 domain-containing protein [Flexivirga sp. ID2601S]|uniref:DUF4352 domain-containing protein n=1 Tax=Flexivirga aerilata TaxID=1656889 RepID=A0A849AFJ1_9MICO|nr:DUF4352 domain-containing protein [Flexivirga aerilata]NNG39604.1 DUF4352 domain-containing protein [Flexivirga aerilata]
MSKTLTRKFAFGVAPAILVATAVAGCNNEGAPSVQAPPSTAVQTSSAAPDAPSSTAGGEVPTQSATDSGVPTESATPSSSADKSKVCAADTSFRTPAAVAPSTKKAAWGKPLDVTQEYGGTVTFVPQAPTTKDGDPKDIFGPDEGQTNLLITVTVTYKSGDSSDVNDSSFTLLDAAGNVCDSDILGDAVPKQQRFDDATVDTTTKTYTGTLVYQVPKGQDYKKYTLLYPPKYGSKDAAVAWTG